MGSAVMTSGDLAVVIAGMREDWPRRRRPDPRESRRGRDRLVPRPRSATAAWVDGLDRAPPQRRPPFSPNIRQTAAFDCLASGRPRVRICRGASRAGPDAAATVAELVVLDPRPSARPLQVSARGHTKRSLAAGSPLGADSRCRPPGRPRSRKGAPPPRPPAAATRRTSSRPGTTAVGPDVEPAAQPPARRGHRRVRRRVAVPADIAPREPVRATVGHGGHLAVRAWTVPAKHPVAPRHPRRHQPARAALPAAPHAARHRAALRRRQRCAPPRS